MDAPNAAQLAYAHCFGNAQPLQNMLAIAKWRGAMKFDSLQEAAVGNCLVRVRSSRIELPGAAGWIGSWEIYRLPWHHRKLPVHTGETDVQQSESVAAGTARAIATAFAFAF